MQHLGSTLNTFIDRQTEMLVGQGSANEDQKLFEQSRSIAEAAIALVTLKMNQHEDDSNLAHSKKVSIEAARLDEKLVKTKEAVADLALKAENGFKAEIAEQTKLEPSIYDAEIRQVIRGMKLQERNKMMTKALDEENLPILSAVLLAPGLLVNMDQAQLQSYREVYETKKALRVINRREAYRKLNGEVDSTFKIVERVVNESALIDLNGVKSKPPLTAKENAQAHLEREGRA